MRRGSRSHLGRILGSRTSRLAAGCLSSKVDQHGPSPAPPIAPSCIWTGWDDLGMRYALAGCDTLGPRRGPIPRSSGRAI